MNEGIEDAVGVESSWLNHKWIREMEKEQGEQKERRGKTRDERRYRWLTENVSGNIITQTKEKIGRKAFVVLGKLRRAFLFFITGEI